MSSAEDTIEFHQSTRSRLSDTIIISVLSVLIFKCMTFFRTENTLTVIFVMLSAFAFILYKIDGLLNNRIIITNSRFEMRYGFNSKEFELDRIESLELSISRNVIGLDVGIELLVNLKNQVKLTLRFEGYDVGTVKLIGEILDRKVTKSHLLLKYHNHEIKNNTSSVQFSSI